jgi:predicted HD superfamily hydrolase involved in NAD metabolism
LGIRLRRIPLRGSFRAPSFPAEEEGFDLRESNWDERIRRVLSPERYRHCVGVAELAMRLAALHGVDPERLRAAGLLHDVAKELTAEEMERVFREHDETGFEEMADLPKLWHASVSAILAEEDYGVADREVLDAIRHHPTGHPSFSTLGDLLFVADYCGPGRPAEGGEEIARQAETDLEGAVLEVIRRKIEYLRQRGRNIHPGILDYQRAVRERKAKRETG